SRTELAGIGLAGDVETPVRSELDRIDAVAAGPAEVGQIIDDRVDHQGAAAVVVSELDGDGIASDERVAGADFAATFVRGAFLVDERPLLHDARVTGFDEQVAIGSDADARGALELHADGGGVGAGLHDEVKFELILVAVVDDIDAGVDALVADTFEAGDIG